MSEEKHLLFAGYQKSSGRKKARKGLSKPGLVKQSFSPLHVLILLHVCVAYTCGKFSERGVDGPA